MLNQDSNNKDERNYMLRTHTKMNENPTYEHDMDAKKKNIKQRHPKVYIENHNQEYDETNT